MGSFAIYVRSNRNYDHIEILQIDRENSRCDEFDGIHIREREYID